MHDRRVSWKTLLSMGLIVGVTYALAGHAQSLPAGPGEAALQSACSTCHSITVVTARRLSQAGWENVVDNMVSRGAQATPEEQKEIVLYLTANFSAGGPAPKNPASGEGSVPAQPQAPAQTQPAPVLDNSQIAHAKHLISSSGCFSCHRMDGKGSFAGPYLGDVGANHTAEQIRTALASPSKELAPQNRSVRLMNHNGKTVVGKLLNQDGFSVQLIDASGHLLSFEKAKLREFTIITTNSMPSYANTIAPKDLSLLINYLETLKGTNQQ